MKAKDIMLKYNISRKTLSRWIKDDKIVYKILPNGRYDYEYEYTNDKQIHRINIIYARVSTTGQKDNLKRQIQRLNDFCSSNGYIIDETLHEIASGMNYNRKQYNKLLNFVLDGKVDNIFIEYEDRLLRFGFDNFKLICDKFNTKIIVINKSENKDTIKEITDDLVNIIHHFSSKIYSLRKNKNKIINILNENN
ncbi:MAG: IS607 family transposase [Saccharofermentanales bacterium]|jgi:predicted site-specific integrase-resolvase